MAVSVVDNKVQLKSDNGIWYEFPLVRIGDFVAEGEITEVADQNVTGDERATIEADDGELYDFFLFTGPDDRQYSDIGQTPSALPDNGPVRAAVDGQLHRLDLITGPDDRIYDRWVVAQVYAEGYVYLDLTANFYKQGSELTVREGDDAREIMILLKHGRRTLATQPERAILKIDLESSGIETRELTYVPDIAEGLWSYRLIDLDFTLIPIGTWNVQVYGFWSDGTEATWPTQDRDALTLIVEEKLDADTADPVVYAAGSVYLDLTANFYKQGSELTVREGDDAREIMVHLKHGRRVLADQPETAILKIDLESSGILTYDLTHRDDLAVGVWAYRLIDYDFTQIPIGTWNVQVYGSWADGTQATWPTKEAQALSLIVEEKLDTDLD